MYVSSPVPEPQPYTSTCAPTAPPNTGLIHAFTTPAPDWKTPADGGAARWQRGTAGADTLPPRQQTVIWRGRFSSLADRGRQLEPDEQWDVTERKHGRSGSRGLRATQARWLKMWPRELYWRKVEWHPSIQKYVYLLFSKGTARVEPEKGLP